MINMDDKESCTVYAGFLTVPPDLATSWLTVNQNNRGLAEKRVEFHMGILQRGEHMSDVLPGITLLGKSWKAPERLLNGQHRLTAQARLGLTLRWHVQVVNDPEIMRAIDTGAARSVGDYLATIGKPNAKRLASALRVVHAYDTRQLHLTGIDRLTNNQVTTLLSRYRGIAKWCGPTSAGTIMRPAIKAGLGYLCGLIDETKTEEFLTGLKEGAPGTAVGLLHKRWLAQKKYHEMQPQVQYGLFIKTWNSFIHGDVPRTLTFDPSREEMPEIEGRPPKHKVQTKAV